MNFQRHLDRSRFNVIRTCNTSEFSSFRRNFFWSTVAASLIVHHTSLCARDLLDGVLACAPVSGAAGANIWQCHVHHRNTLSANTICL